MAIASLQNAHLAPSVSAPERQQLRKESDRRSHGAGVESQSRRYREGRVLRQVIHSTQRQARSSAPRSVSILQTLNPLRSGDIAISAIMAADQEIRPLAYTSSAQAIYPPHPRGMLINLYA